MLYYFLEPIFCIPGRIDLVSYISRSLRGSLWFTGFFNIDGFPTNVFSLLGVLCLKSLTNNCPKH